MVRNKLQTKSEIKEIPSLRDASSDYAALVDKRQELNERLASLAVEQQELTTKIRSPEYSKNLNRERVDAVLSGKPITESSLDFSRERLKEISRERDLIQMALKELQKSIRNERIKVSNLICNQIKPDYSSIVQEIAKKLSELHQACWAYEEYVDRLSDEDIAWSPMGPAYPMFVSSAKDRQGQMARWFQNAFNEDHLEIKMVPERFRLEGWKKGKVA